RPEEHFRRLIEVGCIPPPLPRGTDRKLEPTVMRELEYLLEAYVRRPHVVVGIDCQPVGNQKRIGTPGIEELPCVWIELKDVRFGEKRGGVRLKPSSGTMERENVSVVVHGDGRRLPHLESRG